MGEEPLGRPGDVAVGVEERLERRARARSRTARRRRRAARPSRRRSAAARPGPRSSPAAAAGRRRSRRRPARRALRRRPRRRWPPAAPRRAARGRSSGSAATRLRPSANVWPGSPACSSRSTPSRARAAPRLVAAGQRATTTSAPGASPRSASAATAPGATARAPRSATASDARAPAVLGRRERVRARDDDAAARRRASSAELLGRARPAPRGRPPAASTACRNAPAAASRRARGRADALDLGGDERRDEPQDRRRGRGVGARPQPQLADRLVGDAQLDGLARPSAVAEQRPLVGRRARGDGEHVRPRGRCSARLASSARAAARTTSGSPAPDSTASVIGVERVEVEPGRRPGRRGHAAHA